MFIDPEYINVDVELVVKVDRKKTNKSLGDVQGEVIAGAVEYDERVLNTFGADLNDIDLINSSRGDRPYITSIYSVKRLRKSCKVMYRSTGATLLNFSNGVEKNSVSSSTFLYGGVECEFVDLNGLLYIVKLDGTKMVNKSMGSVDYGRGLVEFKFPEFATVASYTGSTGVVEFKAIPATPDVRTELNNIVKISAIEIKFRT